MPTDKDKHNYFQIIKVNQWVGEIFPQSRAASQLKTQTFIPKLMEIRDRYGSPLKKNDDSSGSDTKK